jgi:hypothetical protein
MNKMFGLIQLADKNENFTNLEKKLSQLGFLTIQSPIIDTINIPLLIVYSEKTTNDFNCYSISDLSELDLDVYFPNKYPFCINPINEQILRSMFSPEFGDEAELKEFVSGLIVNFFKSVENDIVQVEKMLIDQDFDKMRKTFHRIKSTFGTFGLDHSKNLFAIWQKQESFSYNDLILFKMHYSVAKHALTNWIKLT